MKKLIFISIFVLSFGIAYAAPSYIYQRTILPEVDNTFDLGTSTLKWRNLYVENCVGCSDASSSLTLSGISSNSTTTASSLYTMTSMIPVEFRSSDGNPILYLNESSERVGVGTATPGAKFVISGSSATTYTATALSADTSYNLINTNTTNNNFVQARFLTADTNGTLSTGASINGIFTSHTVGGISVDMSFATRNAGTYTERMKLTSAGNLTFTTDNTNDIGASGATRPRTIYAGTNIFAGVHLVAGGSVFANDLVGIGPTIGFRLRGPSDGVGTLLDNAETSFNRLQFGGTSSSFPAIKRNGTALNFRLADDSADANITAGGAIFTNATSTGTLTIPTSATQSPVAAGQIAHDTTSDQIKYGTGSLTKVLGNGYQYASLTYSTSTAWTGTTTIPLGPAGVGETWESVQCFTDTGTVGVSFYDGTNRMDYMPTASTTVNINAFTTNNTFTSGEKRYVDLGTPASTPTKVSCTVKKSITAD